MHIVLVGLPNDRERLRQALSLAAIVVVDEADTLAAARARHATADGFLIASTASATDPEPLVDSLTAREVEVLELLAEGLPNKAIALSLYISDQTVKFHVAQICGKLGAVNRTDAVRLALRRGLVTI